MACCEFLQLTLVLWLKTHATRMFEQGMRELTLQKRLGHASPVSTQIYTQVSDPVVVEEYRRALGKEEQS
jgi:integrase/recombinase XerD